VSYSNDGYPIVEFEVDSSTYQIQSTTSVQIDGQNTLGVGTPMEVIYVQDNPEGAKIYTFGGFWSEAIGLLVLGLLFVGNYWWWWRKQRKIQK
jgi:hypothetical protein